MKKNNTLKVQFWTFAAGLALLFSAQNAHSADTLQRVELTDGSLLYAKVLFFANGVYELKSDSLGYISIPEEKIISIGSVGGSSSPPSFSNPPKPSNKDSITLNSPKGDPATGRGSMGGPEALNLQKQIMSDPETMNMIQELQSDPDIQKILQDPELMRAIQQGDVNRLSADPKIQSLMNNENIEQILQKHR